MAWGVRVQPERWSHWPNAPAAKSTRLKRRPITPHRSDCRPLVHRDLAPEAGRWGARITARSIWTSWEIQSMASALNWLRKSRLQVVCLSRERQAPTRSLFRALRSSFAVRSWRTAWLRPGGDPCTDNFIKTNFKLNPNLHTTRKTHAIFKIKKYHNQSDKHLTN